MKKYPLELIEWYDAESDVSWTDPKEASDWAVKEFVVTEIGFVFHEDKNFIVMVSQIGNDGTVGNRTRIPKPWLKSRKKVGDEKKRNPRTVRVSRQNNTQPKGRGRKDKGGGR